MSINLESMIEDKVNQKLVFYTENNFQSIPQLQKFDPDLILQMRAVSSVLPFRVNRYVVDNLIEWNKIPDDPIFQMTFPQPGMLAANDLSELVDIIKNNQNTTVLNQTVSRIRAKLNPHPAGQMVYNIPTLNNTPLPGIQHKYYGTILFFPIQGQTCHSYCTFCFRWAQFIGDKNLQFGSKETEHLLQYIVANPHLTDIIFTGGDPLIMKTSALSKYLQPLFLAETAHLKNIRLGTKALTYWPQRFVSDPDADDLLRLFERFINAGKHVTIMAHYNHWRELQPAIAKIAIKRLQNCGVVIRSQSPLLAKINDDAEIWFRMWNEQVNLGIVPYYMFVERDTGPKQYFQKTLAEAWNIYQQAMNKTSGLCRTARGPSMSATLGKVEVTGTIEWESHKAFVLRYLQARDPQWCYRPFLAKYDPNAVWFSELEPVTQADSYYFEKYYAKND